MNFEQIEISLRKRLAEASITAPRFATAVDLLNEDPDSPFHKMVDWPNNRFPDAQTLRCVPPTAIENSLKAITRAFPETREDEADAVAMLSSIWKTIFGTYGISLTTWQDWPNLLLKATIQVASEMIVERLALRHDPIFAMDPVMSDGGRQATEEAAAFIRGVPSWFWQTPWRLKSLDTTAGRKIIEQNVRDLKVGLRRGLTDDAIRATLSLYRDDPDSDLD